MRAHITTREIEERDLPLVWEHLRRQAARLGKEVLDVPQLTDFPTLLALAVEKDGEPIGFVYLECIAEVNVIGNDPRVTGEAIRLTRALSFNMRKRGIKHVRSFVERSIERPIGKRLQRAGFVNLDEQYAHYALNLDSSQ
jgi:hypothetical protein